MYGDDDDNNYRTGAEYERMCREREREHAMDPNATWNLIHCGNIDERIGACNALAEWVRDGGFVPAACTADKCNDAAAALLARNPRSKADCRLARALLGLGFLAMTRT